MLLLLYYSYICSYVNYAGVALVSTYIKKPIKQQQQQQKKKNAFRIVFNKEKFEHTRHLFKSNKLLNISQHIFRFGLCKTNS